MSDLLAVDAAPPGVVDRSTIERYATCPAQAIAIERGLVRDDSLAAESGSAVHEALSRATADYMQSRGNLTLDDLRDDVLQGVAGSRPDIQPDAIAGVRASVWSWARFLKGIHHENILRFDGGDGDRSGQVAWNLDDLQMRVTAEVDLLFAGPSPQVIHEIDYKSGHAFWTAREVATAFQFQLHGWLLLHTYPGVDAVECRIWNTRLNSLTYGVTFKRSDLYNLEYRVHEAAALKRRHEATEFADAETWPEWDRCSGCAAAAICPAAARPIADAAADPARLVDELVARKANVAALEKLAAAIVERTGRDILTPAGNAFGAGKMRKPRKPTLSLYTHGKADNGESTGGNDGC